jgi:L-lysine 6-transaminase
MQVCGILASKRVDEIQNNVFKIPSRINSTWGGSLVDMVRATKIMEIIQEDDLCNNATQMGAYLQNQLADIAKDHSIMSNVRGRGLLTSFDFPTKSIRDNFLKLGLEQNVMFLGCAEHTIRFRPALIIDQKNIDIGLTILRDIVSNL